MLRNGHQIEIVIADKAENGISWGWDGRKKSAGLGYFSTEIL